MIVFRFLHIVAGVLWVGSAFLFVGFIGPSAAEVGPAAGPLLHAAVKERKVAKVITGWGARPSWRDGSCGSAISTISVP
jgi:hypothetical protein